MPIQSYRDMIVWQKAMDLCVEIYRLTNQFPKAELYALTNQIRRAAVSIPSNIAEGQARKSTAEFLNFLSIAKGSLAEMETQLTLAVRLGYLLPAHVQIAEQLSSEVRKMLSGLVTKLSTLH